MPTSKLRMETQWARRASVWGTARRVGGFDSDPRRGMSKPRLKINPRQRDRKQHCGTIAAIWLIGCERVSLASHPGVDLWKGKRKFSLVGQSSAMSALPPKADMCSALAHVRYGPRADIAATYSITLSARARRFTGMVSPR